MKVVNINIHEYFHMIPLWKSPIKLPVELPVELPHVEAAEIPSRSVAMTWIRSIRKKQVLCKGANRAWFFFVFWFLLDSKPCFLSFSTQNHAESSRNYLKNSVSDRKRAKLNQKSYFGHVRTYCWLNKLRNTQRNICGNYWRNIYIYIYGIYK